MEININQKCTVILNHRGVEALNDHYSKLNLAPPKVYAINQEYTAPLWHIMHIFGEALYMGANPPFKTTIKIKHP